MVVHLSLSMQIALIETDFLMPLRGEICSWLLLTCLVSARVSFLFSRFTSSVDLVLLLILSCACISCLCFSDTLLLLVLLLLLALLLLLVFLLLLGVFGITGMDGDLFMAALRFVGLI